jgi:glyoxylase-like metal-dependent hydrolase (beta-lactamase superfamily II)
MNIQKIILGELETNCYIVTDRATSRCIVIDPGDNAEVITQEILSQSLEPIALVATHGHFDHILAADELQKNFDIPFLIHKADCTLLRKMRSSAKHWLKHEIIQSPPASITTIDENEIVEFGKSQLKILHTPGHTPGGITLYNENQNTAFTGDTLFKNGVGRSNLSYSNTAKLLQSVKALKNKFKGYQAYPGHEDEFYI